MNITLNLLLPWVTRDSPAEQSEVQVGLRQALLHWGMSPGGREPGGCEKADCTHSQLFSAALSILHSLFTLRTPHGFSTL